jgi:hypothetical protein
VAALVAVAALWREHLRADSDDRTQRDEAFLIAREQVAATNRVADTTSGLAKDVDELARQVAGIRRDMAARRKADS